MRFAPVAALLLVLSGCAATSWQAATPTALPAAHGGRRPEGARMTLTDGTTTTLRRPALRRDSIVGVGEGGAWTAVATADVTAMEVTTRRLTPGGRSTVRTLGLAAGAVLAVGALVVSYALLTLPGDGL